MIRIAKDIALHVTSEALWRLSVAIDRFSDRVMRFGWRVSDAAGYLDDLRESED